VRQSGIRERRPPAEAPPHFDPLNRCLPRYIRAHRTDVKARSTSSRGDNPGTDAPRPRTSLRPLATRSDRICQRDESAQPPCACWESPADDPALAHIRRRRNTRQ
jgi:hypothetical protein